jgi:hypothetical protein
MIVVSDNVTEFFYADNPKEEWDIFKDFPCCAPPRELMFIETHRPSRINSEGRIMSAATLPSQWGWLLKFDTRSEMMKRIQDPEVHEQRIAELAAKMDDLFPKIDQEKLKAVLQFDKKEQLAALGKLSVVEQTFWLHANEYALLEKGIDWDAVIPKDVAWGVECELLVCEDDVLALLATVKTVISKTGAVMAPLQVSLLGALDMEVELATSLKSMIDSLMFQVLLTLSFMHCKNVVLSEVSSDRLISNERRRVGLKPFVRYHTIDIDPMKRVLRIEGSSETAGLQRALHICRGHFSTYSEERPLFGRVAGTFWIPSHVRGSIKEGVVVSDYTVSPVKE